jgi:hypothetical protein
MKIASYFGRAESIDANALSSNKFAAHNDKLHSPINVTASSHALLNNNIYCLIKGMYFSFVFVASIAISGCASIVSDNASTTYIETDPEKARCELHGQDFKRVIETPNSINLPSKSAPMTVSCSATGYRVTTAKLDTELDGWVFGNILFGGIVGVVVDVARGAGQKFPSKVSIILDPDQFVDISMRDAFYDRRKAIAVENWARLIQETQRQCSNSVDVPSTDCPERVMKLQAGKDKELADLEERRLSSTVRTGGFTSNLVSQPVAPITYQQPSALIQPKPAQATPRSSISATNADSDIENQLRKLKTLLDDGLITPNDYDAQKKRLLSRM